MKILYVVVYGWIFACSGAICRGRWCHVYSRSSKGRVEDVQITQIATGRIPNCQWQINFENATKLEMRLQIDQMPFSVDAVYKNFKGIVQKQTFDTLRISSGQCDLGHHIMNITGTTHKTARKLNTDSICFEYISNNDHYNENRLQLRVRLAVLDYDCRSMLSVRNQSNTTKTDCHYPQDKTSTSKQKAENTTPKAREETEPTSTTTKVGKETSTTPTTTVFKKGINFPIKFLKSFVHQHHTQPVPMTTVIKLHGNPYPLVSDIPKYYSAITTTTQILHGEESKTQMSDNDIQKGLYIASVIAGIWTVTIIILVICCVKKSRELKKMTEIMFHMSRLKQDHNKLHRQEFSGWSSATSSFKPALPPRPFDLPSITDIKSQTDITPYDHNDEYDNMGNIRPHNLGYHQNIVAENQLFISNSTSPAPKTVPKDIHGNDSGYKEGIVGTDSKRSTCSTIDTQSLDSGKIRGDYIENTSMKSTMYRKVNKFRP